jgi:carboxymethylenebutenolidase
MKRASQSYVRHSLHAPSKDMESVRSGRARVTTQNKKRRDQLTSCKNTNLFPAYLSRIPFYIEEATYPSPDIKALVSYGGKKFATFSEKALTSIPPQLIHIAGPQVARRESYSRIPDSQTGKPFEGLVKTYRYEDAKRDSSWVLPADEEYHKRSASLAHTRSLEFLKKQLNGPWFDLEAIWDEHTLYEFGERDVDKTMATMVDQPYVNHIPTMTYAPTPYLTITDKYD